MILIYEAYRIFFNPMIKGIFFFKKTYQNLLAETCTHYTRKKCWFVFKFEEELLAKARQQMLVNERSPHLAFILARIKRLMTHLLYATDCKELGALLAIDLLSVYRRKLFNNLAKRDITGGVNLLFRGVWLDGGAIFIYITFKNQFE